MSEQDLLTPLKSESPPAPAEPVTNLGALRASRIAQGLTLQDVAARLKFPAKLIEALEAERFDSLPRGLALKTLVKNYARLLSVDSQSIEASLQPYIGKVTGGIAAHTSTRTLGTHHTDSSFSIGSSMWIVVILSVVIVALLVAIWQGIVPTHWLPTWIAGAIK